MHHPHTASAARLLIACLLGLAASACARWEHDVVVDGVPFEKIRTTGEGRRIGYLSEPTTLDGYPCAKGWVHLAADGRLLGGTLDEPCAVGPGLTLPAGTWILPQPDGSVVCALPEDLEIQGHRCRGTGGPKGVQTVISAHGRLLRFFSPEAAEIDGWPCRGGTFASIRLHPNGRLAEATLAREHLDQGTTLRRGARVFLDQKGKLLRHE